MRIGAAAKRFFAAPLIAAATAFAACAAPASAQGMSVIRDVEIEETLDVYTRPLLDAANIDPSRVRLVLIGDASVNAFVAEGERIHVHTGLIMRARNPNELIGVLAHETGHISGGHLARSNEAINRSMRPALIAIGLGILAIASGAPDAGAAIISGSGQFAQGNFVRYTNTWEASADQAGADFLERSGQSGRGLITFFNREFRPYEFAARRAPAWVVTHPFTSDRIEALRERVENAAHYDAVDTPENIRRFEFMQAKLVGFIEPLSRTLQLYPPSNTSQPARYARAIAYCGCGIQSRVPDLPRALAEISSLTQEDPTNPFFHELQGQILFENRRFEDSIVHHRRSLELRPRTPLFEINLARALIAADGREAADEAIGLLEHATHAEPDNAFAWTERAAAHDLRGEDGMARLSSAERAYVIGDYGGARNFAERARRSLEQGSVAWQRATDIVASVQNIMGDDRGRRPPS
ncbi:MAG: M48 family metalloprotease [Alphaproteobacteria bacterium]|nr:M48 family metalloprotease [Alphaproteobacteria bacterium]